MDRNEPDAWEPCAVLGVSIDPTLEEVEGAYAHLRCELLTHGRMERPMDSAPEVIASSSHQTESNKNVSAGRISDPISQDMLITAAKDMALSIAKIDPPLSGKPPTMLPTGKQSRTKSEPMILSDPTTLRYTYRIWDARPEIWRVDSRNESTSSVPSQVSDASEEGIYDIAGAIYNLCMEHAYQLRKPRSNIIKSILEIFRPDKESKRDRKKTLAVAMQLENLAYTARQIKCDSRANQSRSTDLPCRSNPHFISPVANFLCAKDELHRGLVVFYDDLGRDLKTLCKLDVLEKKKIIHSYEGRLDALKCTYC